MGGIVQGRKMVIRIYYVRKKFIFNKEEKGEGKDLTSYNLTVKKKNNLFLSTKKLGGVLTDTILSL